MTWAAARGAIQGYIEALDGITRCYEFAPDTLQDLPCAVIFGPEVTASRAWSFRSSQYDVLIRFFIKDADLASAHEAVDDLRETLITTFDAHNAIGGEVAVVNRQTLSRVSAVSYGGKDYTGFDMILGLEIHAAPTMSA